VIHTLHLPPDGGDVVRAARATRRPLVTVSAAMGRQWSAAGVDASVIRNGVPDPGYQPATVAPVVLIAGRISPEKGTATAIRVARRAGLIPLVVGDVYDSAYFEHDVRPLLREHEWLGPLPRRELFEIMRRARVLLMPVEWEEAFGLVAAEAQIVGCPVVGYRRGALPEVVVDGIGGWLVEPADESGLVEAVGRSRLLDRESIAANARREFGLSRMLDQYELALTSAAGERSRAA
jgi:glycosyltransferase involved in cell wall biosynthesis